MPKKPEAFEEMRAATRAKIENAALELFARRGLSVGVGEIAKAAGVSQGLLYRYYPSKDALIAALVQQATEISRGETAAVADKQLSARERIEQMNGMMHGMLASNHPGILRFMFMIQVGVSGPPSEMILQSMGNAANPIENLARIIAEGQAEGSVVDGNPALLAAAYWAEIQGLCCYAITGMTLVPAPEMLARILLKEEK